MQDAFYKSADATAATRECHVDSSADTINEIDDTETFSDDISNNINDISDSIQSLEPEEMNEIINNGFSEIEVYQNNIFSSSGLDTIESRETSQTLVNTYR